MADVRPVDGRSSRRPTVPRSFQTRLTIAFIAVVAVTLALVAVVVVNRLDDYFRQQEEESLRVRASAAASILRQFITESIGPNAVVVELPDGSLELNKDVRALFENEKLLGLAARTVAQADIQLEFGMAHPDTDGYWIVDADPGPLVSRGPRDAARTWPGARPRHHPRARLGGRVEQPPGLGPAS